VLRVLAREARRRREAADAFAAAGRADQAAAERAEDGVLAGYLPAQLSDVELAAIVTEVIKETGASGMAAMGQVMKAVTPRVAGRRGRAGSGRGPPRPGRVDQTGSGGRPANPAAVRHRRRSVPPGPISGQRLRHYGRKRS